MKRFDHHFHFPDNPQSKLTGVAFPRLPHPEPLANIVSEVMLVMGSSSGGDLSALVPIMKHESTGPQFTRLHHSKAVTLNSEYQATIQNGAAH